jgi:REP element-mobilizing transposase RayT
MELKFFDPWADITVGTNRLPHWEQPGATYFLTFHLADSLPADLLAQWRVEREAWLKWNPVPWSPAQEREYHERFSGATERWLDAGHGECLLRRADVRAAVAAVLAKFDGDRYWQHAWVLMPNHAHVFFSMKEGRTLPELLKAWKGASSRAAGLVLGRRMSDDAFWQKDYFDRLARDAEHFWNCARYIRRNPMKAKLRERESTLYLSEEVRAVLE